MNRFFSFDARVARPRLIAGLLLALPCVWAVILFLRSELVWAPIAAGILGGMVSAKLLTEAVRRRHDAGADGAAAVWLLAGGIAAMSVAMIYALGSGAFVVPYLVFGVLAASWASLLLRPGDPSANSYGPATSRSLRPSFAKEQRGGGTLVAIAMTVIGGGLGYADVRWLEGMRTHHAEVQRQVAIDQATENTAAPDALETAYRKQKP